MVTKSIIETPFGSKFIYRIDGECVWSEYIQFDPSKRLTIAQRLFAGFQNMWRFVATAA